jgi:hypothetical protein
MNTSPASAWSPPQISSKSVDFPAPFGKADFVHGYDAAKALGHALALERQHLIGAVGRSKDGARRLRLDRSSVHRWMGPVGDGRGRRQERAILGHRPVGPGHPRRRDRSRESLSPDTTHVPVHAEHDPQQPFGRVQEDEREEHAFDDVDVGGDECVPGLQVLDEAGPDKAADDRLPAA